MICRIGDSSLNLEVPLTRIEQLRPLRIGIRAGDILLASHKPEGLSARNVFPGIITSLQQREAMVVAHVDCGANLEVHMTPAAADSLQLRVDGTAWLVVKTYSCQLMQGRGQ